MSGVPECKFEVYDFDEDLLIVFNFPQSLPHCDELINCRPTSSAYKILKFLKFPLGRVFHSEFIPFDMHTRLVLLIVAVLNFVILYIHVGAIVDSEFSSDSLIYHLVECLY